MKPLKTMAALAALASLALTGCSGSDVKSTSPSSTTSSGSTTSQSASSDTSTEGTSSDSKSDMTKAYGSTFTWDDGVAVTVSKPQPFTPSDTASTDSKFKKFVVVDITLKNGSKEPYNAMTLTLTATSGDQQSDGVFDSEKGVDIPSADVLPGKTLKWKQAYGVTDSGELVLSVENGFGNAKGYYK